MSLPRDVVRGIAETVRETLPLDDVEERRCFLAGFWLSLAVQVLAFTLLTLGSR